MDPFSLRAESASFAADSPCRNIHNFTQWTLELNFILCRNRTLDARGGVAQWDLMILEMGFTPADERKCKMGCRREGEGDKSWSLGEDISRTLPARGADASCCTEMSLVCSVCISG